MIPLVPPACCGSVRKLGKLTILPSMARGMRKVKSLLLYAALTRQIILPPRSGCLSLLEESGQSINDEPIRLRPIGKELLGETTQYQLLNTDADQALPGLAVGNPAL